MVLRAKIITLTNNPDTKLQFNTNSWQLERQNCSGNIRKELYGKKWTNVLYLWIWSFIFLFLFNHKRWELNHNKAELEYLGGHAPWRNEHPDHLFVTVMVHVLLRQRETGYCTVRILLVTLVDQKYPLGKKHVHASLIITTILSNFLTGVYKNVLL